MPKTALVPASPERLLHLLDDLIYAKARGLLPGRETLEARQELRHTCLCGNQKKDVVEYPVVVGVRGVVGTFVGISPKVEDLRDTQGYKRLGPNSQRPYGALLHEHHLPVVIAKAGKIAVV